MNEQELKQIIEAVLFAADEPLNLNRLMTLFPEEGHPGKDAIITALAQLQEDYQDHSLELQEIGSGYRFQVKQDYAEWVAKLWEEKPARYSRATLETLALIAYRQPITRAEIEEVRGVSVSSNIIKSLQEREWIKVVGHRDVPGKPALYATTKGFLDYFNLTSLENLPTLAELRDIDAINAELDLEIPESEATPDSQAANDESAQSDDDAQQDHATEDDVVNAEVTPQSVAEETINAEALVDEAHPDEVTAEEPGEEASEALEEALSAEN